VLNVPSGTYTVKSGDTLYIISQRLGISLYSLRKINNKWDNMIYPGQKLIVPAAGSAQNQAPAQTSGKILSKSGVYYTQADLDLLARLVNAEAQGEPYSAQVGVAAVVLNRVKDSYFPNTISGVIYQKIESYYQFTPVENGWINRTATQEARNAAYEALNGSDPSHGALFYFDDSATNKWLWSKPILAYIGHMVFVK
jgi:spore germination cell wall hydrolase CwlJ-like protein